MAGDRGRTLRAADVRFLSLEGGGGKGFAFLGALQALEELNILQYATSPPEPGFTRARLSWELPAAVPARRRLHPKIAGVAGASAGAITALLVSCGYSAADILAVLQSFDFDLLFDSPVPRYMPRVLPDRDARDFGGAAPRPA